MIASRSFSDFVSAPKNTPKPTMTILSPICFFCPGPLFFKQERKMGGGKRFCDPEAKKEERHKKKERTRKKH
jgi:hypothetical protein